MRTSNPSGEWHGGIGQPRIWYPQVGSTMDVAANLAARGAPHGAVVQADVQTAGRGRQGRTWIAAPGSALLTSWILRHSGVSADTGALSPLVALAVIRALRKLAPQAPAQLKWPNDVLIDGRKVAGILLTSRASPSGGVVVAGIGVNLRSVAIPDGVDGASVAEWRPGITAGLTRDAIADSLEAVWQVFAKKGTIAEVELEELQLLMAWRNERVTLLSGDGRVSGIAKGIASDGSLQLEQDDGSGILHLRVGEIVRGPRPIRPKG